MAILQTDGNSIAVTNNSGKTLLRTSGSILDYRFNSRSSLWTFTASSSNYNTEIPDVRATITPKSTSSRFLIIVTLNVRVQKNNFVRFKIRRYINNSFNTESNILAGQNINGSGVGSLQYLMFTFAHIDHPNTTSPVQYRIGCSNSSSSATSVLNSAANQSSMVVLEIA